MSPSDIKLIQQAYASRDHQEVDQLLIIAESEECRQLLTDRSRYLYISEEAFAGVN